MDNLFILSAILSIIEPMPDVDIYNMKLDLKKRTMAILEDLTDFNTEPANQARSAMEFLFIPNDDEIRVNPFEGDEPLYFSNGIISRMKSISENTNGIIVQEQRPRSMALRKFHLPSQDSDGELFVLTKGNFENARSKAKPDFLKYNTEHAEAATMVDDSCKYPFLQQTLEQLHFSNGIISYTREPLYFSNGIISKMKSASNTDKIIVQEQPSESTSRRFHLPSEDSDGKLFVLTKENFEHALSEESPALFQKELIEGDIENRDNVISQKSRGRGSSSSDQLNDLQSVQALNALRQNFQLEEEASLKLDKGGNVKWILNPRTSRKSSSSGLAPKEVGLQPKESSQSKGCRKHSNPPLASLKKE